MRSSPGRWFPLALLWACASAAPNPVASYSPSAVEEPITAVIGAALDADRQNASADSLWAPGATVIANGEPRSAPPRFAGIQPGGEVAITSSRLEVRQSVAWVYLEYRWMSLREGTAKDGKATVVLTPKSPGGSWWIVHLHTSAAP